MTASSAAALGERAYLNTVAFDLPHPGRVKTPLLVLGTVNDQAISVAEAQATASDANIAIAPNRIP